MKKNITIIFLGFIVVLSAWYFLGINNCDSSTGECDLSGNEGQKEISEVTINSLPEGYTLDSYDIEKVTDTSCNKDSDCETPMDYLVQSRCPFTSLCLENKCTIVCPGVKTMEFQGEIISVKPEMDGSILTVSDGENTYEILVSIPNLGEEYVSSIKNIEVGRYIQVVGNVLKLKDSERIIASQIYVEGTFTGEHPCNLEPNGGSCEAAMPRYYFDKEEGKCKEFLWGGCDGTVPFDSLEVCMNTCEINLGLEKSVPSKPILTAELCESNGGRVVDTSVDSCTDEEIDIGVISSEPPMPIVCCMITGGSASSGGLY